MSPEPWQVLHSRVLLEDRWLKLRAEECKTSQNGLITPFYILDFPNWVLVIAQNAGGLFLIERQYRHGIGKVQYEFPAGVCDKEDLSPIHTAQRELAEETGFGGGQWKHIATLPVNPHNHSNHYHIVFAHQVEFITPPENNPQEIIAVQWMSSSEITSLMHSGEFNHPHHIAAWFLAKSNGLV